MAKLAPQAIRAEAPDKTRFAADVAVSVTSDGKFRVMIPDELRDIVNTYANGKGGMFRSDWSIYCKTSYADKNNPWSVEAKRLDVCVAVLQKAAEEFLLCEVKTERVILYALELSVAMFIKPDGTLSPCGYSRGAEGGTWYETKSKKQHINANSRIEDTYRIGLAAEVWDKTSHIRASGTKTTWERVTPADRFRPESPLAKLQSFCSLSIGPTTSGIKEMAYSDAAALWFHDCIMSLFRMAHSMDNFFSNEENLLAIQNGTANSFLSIPQTRRQLQLQAHHDKQTNA